MSKIYTIAVQESTDLSHQNEEVDNSGLRILPFPHLSCTSDQLSMLPSSVSESVTYVNDPSSKSILKFDQLEDRLKAYTLPPSWNGPLDAPLMAEAGFVYTGQEDLVYCFSCNIKLDGWTIHMDPLLRHKEESPTCSFVRQQLQVMKGEKRKVKSIVAPSKPLNPQQTASIGQLKDSSVFNANYKPVHTVVTGLDEPQLFYTTYRGNESGDDHSRMPLLITVENYRSEEERLESFLGWPLEQLFHPEQLARVGFVYTGEGSLVQCFQCGVRYRNWLKGDVPLSVHQRCNPRCAFLHSLSSKIKSSAVKPSKSFIPDSLSVDVQQTESEDNILEFPNYTDQGTRLQSFKYWGGVLPKEELAEAGFYFVARRDVVRCFSCHVVLQDWERTDNVIVEHRKLSPDCPFLKAEPEESFGLHKGALKRTAYSFKENHSMPQLSTKIRGISTNLRVNVEKETFSSNQTTILPPNSTNSSEEKRVSEILRYQSNHSMLWRPSADFKNTNAEMSAASIGNLCRICYNKRVECVFLPCGHARTCEECAEIIVKSSQPCPYCKTSVSTTHKIFL